MAIWQFLASLVPRIWVEQDGNGLEMLYDGEGYNDTSSAWKNNQPTVNLAELISRVLPPAESWCDSLRIWGDERRNDIQVSYEGGDVEEITIRIDTREDTSQMCFKLVELARALDCCLFLPSIHLIIKPEAALLKLALRSSEEALFSKAPREFIEHGQLVKAAIYANGDKAIAALLNVTPTEGGHLVLEFEGEEPRLFDTLIAQVEKDWPELAYPKKFKKLAFNAGGVSWPQGRTLDARYLHEKSKVICGADLKQQMLRLSYKNQAPTAQHKTHHVYGVYLYPFRERPFEVGESIGGGHGEMGGSNAYSLAELLTCQDWQESFELSGCAWAIPMVQDAISERELLRQLVAQICIRAG